MSPKKTYNQVSMGFGNKSDFLKVRDPQDRPAPGQYNIHETQSMSYINSIRKNNTPHGFFNKYDKYEKICYKGMEQHFYLRETVGPGAYISQDTKSMSRTLTSMSMSIPKNDRGLLTMKKLKGPGPAEYDVVPVEKVAVKSRNFKIPLATRDIPF